tara:strand:+ start:1244 stop:2281 length:1038 start_codon:yes stop_codon:yes gene_type:complete
MDFNYTLRYRTFDQLLEDVSIDLHTFALENMIEPQTLIKLARRLNYDLGLRINQTKEAVLDVCHGKVKLPDDFYVFNYALICTDRVESVGYGGMSGGTNIQEVPYNEVPSTVNQCAPPTVNCRTCNSNPCNNTAACDLNHPIVDPIPTAFDPLNPYGDTCIAPRVFMNCKGENYELIQVVSPGLTRTYKSLVPLRMKASQEIDCECPNLYYNTPNEGWIKNGYLFTTFETGTVYINYQGELTDDQGNLMVPDHELLNEYYEYSLKKRILENLYLNGEDVASRLQVILPELKAARNVALSLVNTPNFKEMEQLWWTNRRAQYAKYYDMFKSHTRGNYARFNPTRVI